MHLSTAPTGHSMEDLDVLRGDEGTRPPNPAHDQGAQEIADGRMTFRPIDDEGYLLDEDGNRIEE